MSILIDKNSKVLVQGITGTGGSFHAKRMKAYGTNIVGGTSPGKGGRDDCDEYLSCAGHLGHPSICIGGCI